MADDVQEPCLGSPVFLSPDERRILLRAIGHAMPRLEEIAAKSEYAERRTWAKCRLREYRKIARKLDPPWGVSADAMADEVEPMKSTWED